MDSWKILSSFFLTIYIKMKSTSKICSFYFVHSLLAPRVLCEYFIEILPMNNFQDKHVFCCSWVIYMLKTLGIVLTTLICVYYAPAYNEHNFCHYFPWVILKKIKNLLLQIILVKWYNLNNFQSRSFFRDKAVTC